MLQFCITTTPSGRVIVSMFLPEDAVEGSQLGALIADLGCLIQLGLPEAAVAECKQCDFVSAKVGPESSKYAGTSIGQNQALGDILGMGVTSIAVVVRRREVPATLPTRSLMDALRRSPALTFPDWGGSGNKAYGDLYTALKAKLVQSGFMGFKDEKHGLKFMKSLVQVLYGLSTFWENFAHRRCTLDPYFDFSSGANDWKAKKISQPVLSQEKIEQLIQVVGLVLADPLLDAGTLSELKVKLGGLMRSLTAVMANLVADAKAKAARDANAGPTAGAYGFLAASSTDNRSITFKAAAVMLHPNNAKVELILATTPLYVPVSLSLFMPDNRFKRARFLEELQLRSPCAVIKLAVGGSIGTLSWVVRCESPCGADSAEMAEAMGRITAVVPQYLSRARRQMFQKKLSLVANLSSSVSAVLFREFTGDQSVPNDAEKKKREAYVEEYVMLAGDPDVLADLVFDMRAESNAQRLGQTAYQDFWNCALSAVGTMQTEAEQRRHGGVVVFASEVISHKTFYKRVSDFFDTEQQAGRIGDLSTKPSPRWLEMQFWPRDEHSANAGMYSGRVPLRMTLMRRTLRKHHAHKKWCMALKLLHEAFLRHHLEFSLYIQTDDKAIIPIGAPGAAVAATPRARATPGPAFPRDGGGGTNALGHGTVGAAVAMDHDAGHVDSGVIVTVSLVVELTANPNDTKYKGDVFFNCKNKNAEGSSADRAKLEIWRLVDSPVSTGKHILGMHGDGGGELNVKHPSVQFALVNLFLTSRGQFDKLVATRGAPYYSYFHEVERIMAILNLALYSLALERPPFDEVKYPGEEMRFRKCKNAKEIRAAAVRFPAFREALLDCFRKVHAVLEERFLQLSLKEVPFKKAPVVEEKDADEFFEVGRVLLEMSATRRGEIKREHLTKGKFKEFEDLHVTKDPYKYEVEKGCWRRALLALCAQYPDGEPPPGAVEALFETSVCPFNCPPPRLPWRVFAGMKEVPRPTLSGGSTKFDSFEDCYGQHTPLVLPPLGNGATVELAPAGVLVKTKARARVECAHCCKPRVVYVDLDPKRVDMERRKAWDVVVDVLSENEDSYTCGSDLDLGARVFPARARPFVRLKISCSSPPELILWTADVLTLTEKGDMCGWCGLTGAQPPPEEGEATLLLPVCPGCLQQHKEARKNGKKPTVDLGGRRAATTAAATQRVADIRGAQAKATAAGPAAGRAAAAAITAAARATPAGGAAWPANVLAGDEEERKEEQAVLREDKPATAGGFESDEEERKEEQAVLREDKPATAGGFVTATAAAPVGAALREYEDAAGVAEPKATPDDAAPAKPVPDDVAATSEARNAIGGGGAAEAMDEDDPAAAVAGDTALPPPAKDVSPPRGRGARGMKSVRAARPGSDEVRNSGDKPARRVGPPRAAATNHTGIVFRAGRN